MKNVSSEFREKLNNGNRNYIKSAKITLKDGTELNLTDKVFWNNGVKIEDATSNQNSFDIGSVIIGQLTLNINNMYDDYSDYDFTDSKITNVTVGMKLSNDVVESLQYGQYTVNETSYNGSIIALTAYDNMYKFDQPYSKSTLSYPATLLQIVQDACSKCDVQLGSFDFSHSDFVVQNRPEDESITFRNILQWVAQISCCYCKIDPQGRLIFGWYDTDILENMFLLNGGNFLNWESTKDTVSGGSFNPWTEGELISGGDFSASSDYHLINSFNSLTLATDDVVITGVKVVEEVDGEEGVETKTYQSGTDGYVLSVEGNKLIQEAGMTVVGFLAEKLIGLRFRSFTASTLSDPTIESGDIAILTDRKGNTYKTIITSNIFQPGNFQNISCGAETPARKSATRYSQATQIYVDYRREIQKERTEREKALEELDDRIDNSSGVFTTVEKQTDGSNIYYLHNKPQLTDSDIIWKMTAEAWGVSTDGGKTYNAGMTVDGDTIVRILTATGVNADWIKAGAIQVTDDDGNVIFSVDMDTKQVIISGDSVRIGGKTATVAIDDVLQESKDYSDGKLADFADTVTSDLSGLQAQIDGQIETYYEDYEPTLQNYPASEWTTTEERKKHEGDLFYWKSKGYAYRFFQDGATWKWQLVQDTDITQAMAAAEKAQDTADGKRRVFVVTPQPPYDIGDLWTNGEDILTCSTARPAGSVYVSTDWEKLNSYTDDTVANEALEEARKARNLNMILDNEFQGIYTDYSGNIESFPSVSTTVQVLYGHTDVSMNCTYSIEKSASITGSWNNATRTYTVTGLSADSGWVDITASYLNLFTVTKRFKVEKIKGGENGAPGQNGTPARIFMIEPSVNLLKRSKDDTISPNFIEFKSYYRDGDNANRVAYSGRWVIEETADGDVWNTIYTSSSDENTVIHYVYSLFSDSDGSAIASSNGDTIGIPRDVVAIRAKLYASGGTTNLLDMQSVSVVVDVDALTHDEIFDLLTNNGQIKGIYKEGNQLYISFTYAKGGTLTLGGVNNGDGELTILDSSGKQIGYAGNTGVRFGKGTFLGTIYGYEARIQKSILMSTKPEGSSDIEIDSDYVRAVSTWNANVGGNTGYSISFATSENGDPKRCIAISIGDQELLDTTIYGDSVLIVKDLSVGGEKNRLVKTESFGERKLSCYEMTSPMFGDIGTAETDEDGECVIYIDDVFYETVSSEIEYQVFLQKEGQGDLWVSQKNATYFCVNGTPNLKFSWEIKIKQRDYEYNRLNPNIPVDKAIGVENLLPTSITRDLEELLK